MKTLKMRELCKLVAIMALVIVFSTACDNDDPILPDYAGTWVTVKTMSTDTGYVQVKEIVTLTENSYSDLLKLQTGNDTWTSLFSMSGTMYVSGSMMNVTLTEVGVTSFSGVNGEPTGEITSYKKGTPLFDFLITEKGQAKTFEAKYTISDNKMTIQTDQNSDGDYLDEMETSVYTKQ